MTELHGGLPGWPDVRNQRAKPLSFAELCVPWSFHSCQPSLLIFPFGFIFKKIARTGFWYEMFISKMKRKRLSACVIFHWFNWFSQDLSSERTHNIVPRTRCVFDFTTIFTAKIFTSILGTNFITMVSFWEGLWWGLLERGYSWPPSLKGSAVEVVARFMADFFRALGFWTT